MQTPFKTKILSTDGKHKLKVDISPFLFHIEVDLGNWNGDISYCNKGSEVGQREFRKRRFFKIRTKLETVSSSWEHLGIQDTRLLRYKAANSQIRDAFPREALAVAMYTQDPTGGGTSGGWADTQLPKQVLQHWDAEPRASWTLVSLETHYCSHSIFSFILLSPSCSCASFSLQICPGRKVSCLTSSIQTK